MPPKPFNELLADLEAEPNQSGIMQNVVDDLIEHDYDNNPDEIAYLRGILRNLKLPENQENARFLSDTQQWLEGLLTELIRERMPPAPRQGLEAMGGRKVSQTKRFNRCVKAVRRTIKARKGSSKESAAIAICTKSILHPRGRTLKRYKKGRLLTQKRRT